MGKLEGIFYKIGGVGTAVIILLTILLIDTPFKVIQGINYDYPMFLLYSVPLMIFFYVVLYIIFKIIVKNKEKK